MRTVMAWAAGALALLAGIGAAQGPQQLAPPVKPAARTAQAELPATTAGAAAEGRAQLTKADADAWLDGFMPYTLRNGDVAGAAVVVVKDGRILTERGYGYADVASRKPVDPERTLFRQGSVSKLVTWTAVMQQVEQGRIDLDADVNRYLDFRIPPRDGKPITMRQIMTHTSGFADHAKNIISNDRKDLKPLGDYLKSGVPDRIFAPGTTPAYSNYATALAGYIVSHVSGMSYDDYVDRNILGPLGMAHSTFRQPLPARLAPLMASGYQRASGKPSPYEFVGPAPAGSMAATGSDMARFMIAHLQGGQLGGARILRPETARTMHDTPTRILPLPERMELGFFGTDINGHRTIGHGGDTQVFHTALTLFLDDGVGLYIAVNSLGRDGAAAQIRGALLQDFANRYFPGPPLGGQHVDARTAAEHARMMAGLWRSSRRVNTGIFDALGLFGQMQVGVGPKGELSIPSLRDAGGAPRKWVEIAPFMWRDAFGPEVLAAEVKDGRIVRWSTDAASINERVPAAKSAAWVKPLLFLALAVLLLTFLHWPAAALVRRHYNAPLAVSGRERQVYRLVRLFAGLTLVMLAGWAVVVTSLLGDLTQLNAAADGKLWFLQIAGLIVFVGAALLAVWNVVLAWRSGRRWTGKVGAVAVLLSALMVLYVAAVFGMLDMTVRY